MYNNKAKAIHRFAPIYIKACNSHTAANENIWLRFLCRTATVVRLLVDGVPSGFGVDRLNIQIFIPSKETYVKILRWNLMTLKVSASNS